MPPLWNARSQRYGETHFSECIKIEGFSYLKRAPPWKSLGPFRASSCFWKTERRKTKRVARRCLFYADRSAAVPLCLYWMASLQMRASWYTHRLTEVAWSHTASGLKKHVGTHADGRIAAVLVIPRIGGATFEGSEEKGLRVRWKVAQNGVKLQNVKERRTKKKKKMQGVFLTPCK